MAGPMNPIVLQFSLQNIMIYCIKCLFEIYKDDGINKTMVYVHGFRGQE